MLSASSLRQTFSVQIRDHALILFLPQQEQQSLWRFDLDTLIEQAFCVAATDGTYTLSMKNLDGENKLIARFPDKTEASAVLDALYDALTAKSTVAKSESRLRRWFGWLTFWRGIFLLIVLALVWMWSQPSPKQTAIPLPAGLPMQDLPAGVPLDADQMLE